jgi:hypothetical protein
VALRAGYELPMRLSFELAGGMLSLGRDLSRTMTRDFSAANGMDVSVAYRIDDALRFRAGFVGGGVGYRLPVAGPFELRAHALLGVLFVDASDGASGEASAGAEQAALLVSKGGDSSVGISMMAAPEVDFDLRFDDFSAGLGLTVAVVFLDGPNTALGDVYVQGSCDPASPGAACAPGQTFVRDERAHGTFVTVLPNLHLGYRF